MAFLGMRGTGDWAADERPKSWRETILYLYPNGSVPLTAILSKMSSEPVSDPEFNWWTKSLAGQSGAITGVYTDEILSTAYVSGGVSGSVLYVKMAAALVSEFRAGHTVMLRDASDYTLDCVAKVTKVVSNGASSYLTISLLEADDNSTQSHYLADADRILIIGSVQAEGAPMPDAVAYNPTKIYNYTEIFETPLEITRTAKKTKLRTKNSYIEAKREALELHGIEMEKSWIWGIRTENTGSNGKPERTTGGILWFIKTYAPNNVDDFSLNTDYTGKTWLQGGEDWLDEQLEQIFRYGADDKLALCGSGALLGINRLVKANGMYQLAPKTTSYGIKVIEWVTPFGIINLKTHPLFSYEETNRNSCIILEPSMLKYRHIEDSDTFFKPDKSEKTGGPNSVDGTKESFLTEAGLEMHHPSKFGYLNGFNTDNDL